MIKEKYINEYFDSNGNVIRRRGFRKVRVFFFAGIKYLFDRILAIILLIILLPIALLISLIIKIDSKGPILFKQERTGKNGNIFYMYKFRSMVVDNDIHDLTKEDEFTRVGRFIRKTSLDELPQFINIVMGNMSFIGPRPWIPEYYDNMNKIQRHRSDVRPGITGLAQVMGRNDIGIIEKINYDLEYIKNYSLIQDIKIVFLTIKTVFSGKGVDAGKTGIKNELEDLKKQTVK